MKCPGDTSSARGFSAEKQAQQGEPTKKELLSTKSSFLFIRGLRLDLLPKVCYN